MQALRFAKAMKAPLIFCSSSHSINIKTIFKIVVSKVFDLKCDVKKIDTVGDPIVGMYSLSLTHSTSLHITRPHQTATSFVVYTVCHHPLTIVCSPASFQQHNRLLTARRPIRCDGDAIRCDAMRSDATFDPPIVGVRARVSVFYYIATLSLNSLVVCCVVVSVPVLSPHFLRFLFTSSLAEKHPCFLFCLSLCTAALSPSCRLL